jgi:hypothetical protein
MRALCHRSPVERRYYSGACSLSFALSVLLSALVVVLPLLLAHGSRGADEEHATRSRAVVLTHPRALAAQILRHRPTRTASNQ